MFFRFCLSIILAAIPVCLRAGDQPALSRGILLPAHCGNMYAPPFAAKGDSGSRKCGAAVRRIYTSRYRGLGFEILDSESQACFVPDQEYRLLDEIVDAVVKSLKYDPSLTDRQAKIEQARQISKKISDTLKARGFALYIPTETVSDALIDRNLSGEPERHIFDCDTGSFIFLTVAENLGAPVALVEITLPSGSGHNYVRWRIDDQTSFDWDMNGQSECVTPANIASYEGKSMTRQETLGYALTLRASLWETSGLYGSANSDYREAMKLYPQAPGSYNNFAWMIATKEMPGRKKLEQDALVAAEHAVTIARKPNYLDTLACVCALQGNFQQAIKYESEAAAGDSRNSSFQERLAQFKSPNPKDCTGAK
jgi:tetratricopeptide (TPR) repeat protein